MRRLSTVIAFAMGLSACATDGFRGDYVGLLEKKSGSGHEVSTFYGTYLAARHAVSNRDNKAAAAYYRQVLQSDPENQLVLERAFLLGVTSGNLYDAKPLAEKIVAVRPSNRIARMALAIEDIRRGNHADARSHMNQTAKGLYNGLAIDLITAWSFAGEGNFEEAEQAMEKSSGITLDPVVKSLHLGLIYQVERNPEKAEEHFLRSVEASGNTNPRVTDAYGRFLERQGRWGEAIELYNELLVMVPQHPVIEASITRAKKKKRPEMLVSNVAEGTAEAVYSVASMLTLEHTIDLAVIYLQMGRHLRADFHQADMLVGELFQQRGQLEDAVLAFAEIPKTNALGPGAGVLIAMNFDRLGRPDDAVRVLNNLIRKNPENLNLLIALGELLRSHESYPEAIAVFDQAFKVLGDGQQNWFLYYARGAALERAGRWPESENDLLRALDLAPEQPLVLNYLGYSWVERGYRVDDALALVEKAVNLAPDNGFIVDSLGWAHFRLGNIERAVQYLERAVELEPVDPMLHDHLGDAYWASGRDIEAEFEWRHALDLNPSKEDVATIEKKLNDRVQNTVSNGTEQ